MEDYNNALRGLRDELRSLKEVLPCKSRTHYLGLLIDGFCLGCRRIVPPPAANTKVFERLTNLKKSGV